MFKRMSILLRRRDDTREAFAAKWESHGALVAQLPLIRAYLQNHILETFTPEASFEADGIVELKFERPEDMVTAFASAGAVAVKADEPGFLGHGTGYALQTDTTLLSSADGGKLIVVCGEGAMSSHIARLVEAAATLPGFQVATRDDVASVIARVEMDRPPQQVATFVHLLFSTPEDASRAGSVLAHNAAAGSGVQLSVFRVRTNTVIAES